MPRIISSDNVICTICEQSHDQSDDWAHGKQLPGDFYKTTFKKHAQSKKHTSNIIIVPARASLIEATTNALNKSEAKTIGPYFTFLPLKRYCSEFVFFVTGKIILCKMIFYLDRIYGGFF